MATMDGVSLLLPRVTSLLPRVGRSLVVSLLVVYWTTMLHNFSVVYLKMSLNAQKVVVVACHTRHFRMLSTLAP
jgi:hypothetical protein